MHSASPSPAPALWSHPSSAIWITAPSLGGPRTVPPAIYYRRTFLLDAEKPLRALLHVTALGLIECEINGQRVSDDVFAPGWTDYRRRVYYRTYDVTELLRRGENAIGTIVGDGWYSGHVGEKDRQFYGNRPSFACAIEEQDATGNSHLLVATDTSWRRACGPILENDLLMGESYDARLEFGAWSSPGFVDAAWLSVEIHPTPAIAVERAPGPPVRRQEILQAQHIDTGPDLRWEPCRRCYDFGQNFAGRLRLRVRGRRGAHLRLRHAEMLQTDRTLYTENLRTARATDHYTLKGGGIEEWEPCFTFHGFRYADIVWQGVAADVEILAVEGVVLHSDLPRTGVFECSHPLLNRLAQNILWSAKSNHLEVPTDCPQRDERLGWTGDAQVFARSACFLMDARLFFRKWLQDVRDSQSPLGEFPSYSPFTGSWGLPADGGPGWADASFVCPWTIYLCYGDTEVLREHYASMARYLDYLAAQKVRDFIRVPAELDPWGGHGDWLALDGSPGWQGGTPKDLIGTAYYAHSADLMARTATVLGKRDDAARYGKLHRNIVAAFQRRFVTAEGLLNSGTQTSYVLALHFALIPESLRAAATRELVRLIERNGNRIGTGFLGTPYILHVLEAQGRLDVAYRLLEQEAFPSWLFPVKNGATTVWERWDGWTPEKGFADKAMNSFNHYGLGAVLDWMVRRVAGLELDDDAPGGRHVRFKPRPGGTLTHARAELRTPVGRTEIHWRLEPGELVLVLRVPAGASATLDFPPECGRPPQSLASGEHELRAPWPVASPTSP